MEKPPIGKLLKALREAKGMSQRQVGKGSGLDRGFISQVESGKTSSMTLRVLEKWASGLDMAFGELLDRITGEDLENDDIRSFLLYEYPKLSDEEKSWLRQSVELIRERIQGQNKEK